MKSILYLLFTLTLIFSFGYLRCHSQQKKPMQNQISPLICDLKNGVCENLSNNTNSVNNSLAEANIKPVKIVYFTDPICSSCWGIEAQLRKLKLEYGNIIEFEYRMGGLLPNWSYNNGGISKPSDVAHHWDEVSVFYDMPIDGDVWLEDPLSSSYPPSIAFKAAQMQDNDKAILFLRELREMVFLQKKNIAKWDQLKLAGIKVGLDITNFTSDYEGKAKDLFEEDLKLGKELGVRGFPTMIFTTKIEQKEIVYGTQPYSTYENALLKLFPNAAKTIYAKTWSNLFSKYHSLTAKEFSVLTGLDRSDSEKYLNELTDNGKLERNTIKNGAIWRLKNY